MAGLKDREKKHVTPTETTIINMMETTKRKPGRPRVKPEGEYKKINIAVPIEVYNQMVIAKFKFSDNMTEYVNAVIQKDLSENMELYEQIQKLLSK